MMMDDEDLTSNELQFLWLIYMYNRGAKNGDLYKPVTSTTNGEIVIPLTKKGYLVSDWMLELPQITMRLTKKGLEAAELFGSFKIL